MVRSRSLLPNSWGTGYRTRDGRIVQGDIPDGVFIGHNDNRHRVEDLSVIKYPKIWAWVMKDPIKYEPPRAYKHVRGCVIWNPLAEAKSAVEKNLEGSDGR